MFFAISVLMYILLLEIVSIYYVNFLCYNMKEYSYFVK